MRDSFDVSILRIVCRFCKWDLAKILNGVYHMVMFTADDIRKLRLTLGMTLAEFGALVGKTESAVSSWETGRSHPRFEAIRIINGLADDLRRGKLKPLKPAPVRRGPRQPKESSSAS